MTLVEILMCLAIGIGVVYAMVRKPRKIKSVYQPYFARLNEALREKHGGSSAGIIDLDRLDSNVRFVRTKLGDGYKLRLVTKSLPSLELLKYLMTRLQTNRLMVFSESFIAEILSQMNSNSLDLLLGKPLPVEAFIRLAIRDRCNAIHWLIDTKQRLDQYLSYAQKQHNRIKISLEIDVGLHRGGFETMKDFTDAVQIIKQNSQYLELTGLMGYDGHVPYVPFYINRERSIRQAFVHVQELYEQFVNELKKHFDAKTISTMTFNSGGSHTYFYYSDCKSNTPVNDIAIGSGLLAPQQFSDLIRLGHQPALFLSSPVVKKIPSSPLPHVEKLTALLHVWDPNLKVTYFMLDGGWPGELVGPSGLKRNHWWDANQLGYTNLLPNQSVVSSSDANNLSVGDFVFYHAWEGDGMLCFKKIVLYRHRGFVEEWDTYRGGN